MFVSAGSSPRASVSASGGRLTVFACLLAMAGIAGGTTVFSSADGDLNNFQAAADQAQLHTMGMQSIPSPGDFLQTTIPANTIAPGSPAGELFPAGTDPAIGLIIRTNGSADPSAFQNGGNLVVTGPLAPGDQAFVGPSVVGEGLEILAAPPAFTGLVRALALRIRPDGDLRVRISAYGSDGALLASELLPAGTTRAAVLSDGPDLLRVHLRVGGGYAEISEVAVLSSAGPVDAGASSLAADPTSGLLANDSDAAVLTVALRDSQGRLRAGGGGAEVFLSTTLGTLEPVFSNSDGTLSSRLVSNQPGLATVTARLESDEIIGTAQVTFDPDPSAPLPILVISASDAVKWEGDADPDFQPRYSGFLGEDDPSLLEGELLFTREPGELPGSYRVMPSGVSSNLYDIRFDAGSLVIEPLSAARIHADAGGFAQDVSGRNLYVIGTQPIPSAGLGTQLQLPGASVFPGQASGSLFPQGTLEALGITLQANTLGDSPAVPSPGGFLLATGPATAGDLSRIGPANTSHSLDLIIDPPGFQGLVRAVEFPVSTLEAAVTVRVFDSRNSLLDSKILTPGTGYVGIVMPADTFVRVNIHAEGGVDVGDISLHAAAGPLDPQVSTLAASPSSNLLADGSDAARITVTARDQQGRLRAGAADEFFLSTTLGSVGLLSNQGDGTYHAWLTSGIAGNATVVARTGDAETGALVGTASVSFDRLPPAVAISEPSATLTTIPYLGRATVSATVLSLTGSAVPGVTAVITSSPADILDHPAQVLSDANGVVAFEVASSGTGSGNITLTVSIDGASASLALTVLPKTLRVIAQDKTKAPGSPDPAFTVGYEGFVPGDDESVLQATLVIVREPGEALGTYRINPSGLQSDSYQIEFVSGNLVIANPPFASVFATDTGENPTFAATVLERGYYLLGRQSMPSPVGTPETILPVSVIFPGQEAGPLLPTGTEPQLGLTIRTNTATAGPQGFAAAGPLAITAATVPAGTALIGPANIGDTLDLLIHPPNLQEEIRAVSFNLSAEEDASVLISLLDGDNAVLDSIMLPPGTRSVGLMAQEAGLRRIHIAATQGLFAIGEIGLHLASGPLIARDDELFFPASTAIKYHVSQLLDNDIDLEGAVLDIVAVSGTSSLGGTATLDGSWIFYTPPPSGLAPGQEDAFSATVSNGTITVPVQVRIIPVPAPTRIAGNLVKLTPLPGGGARALFAGIPGLLYHVQASSDLVSWETLGSVVTDPQGRLVIEDLAAGAVRFYRLSSD